MNLVEEKQRGLIPSGLQSWPIQLIEYLTNTTSVVPPLAGPAGCRHLYHLHLLNLSFTMWVPNRCCILKFRAHKVLYATSLILLGLKCKFMHRKPCLSCFGGNIRDMLTPNHVLCDCYAKIFCGLNVFHGLLVQCIVMKFLFVCIAESLS